MVSSNFPSKIIRAICFLAKNSFLPSFLPSFFPSFLPSLSDTHKRSTAERTLCHGECLSTSCSAVSQVSVAHAHGAVSVCARPSSVRAPPVNLRGRLLRGVLFFSVLTRRSWRRFRLSCLTWVCGESCYSETLCESPCYGIPAAMVWYGRLLMLRLCCLFYPLFDLSSHFSI